MALIVLGVDPGSRTTGFGILKIQSEGVQHLSHGIIQLQEKESFPRRILDLGQDFSQLLRKYQPDHVVIEKIFLGKNADSAFKLGHARGVIMYEALRANAKVFEYATRVVKKSVTGQGGSDKEQVQSVLQWILKIPQIQKLDASDALAMAYHHALEIKKQSLLESAIEI